LQALLSIGVNLFWQHFKFEASDGIQVLVKRVL